MDFRSVRGAYVVLDATELHRDWFLVGLEFQLLRYLAREAGICPVVPASVVSETIANHGREYARARKALVKAASEFRRVGGVFDPMVPEEADCLAYQEILSDRLESLGVEVVEPPATSHAEIFERAAARRPPFDQTGSGYRDTLTWMTCLELASRGRDVYLVSQDRDFVGADYSLAPELATEASTAGASVTLVRHLGKWLTPLVPWRGVTDPREAAALARDEEVLSMFAPWDMFEDPGFTAEEMGLPPSATIHEVSYHGSGPLNRLNHEKASRGGDRVTYEFPIEFEVEFTLRAEKAREAGFLREGGYMGMESIKTIVPMTGLMTVVHNERDLEAPLYLEHIEFESQSSQALTGWADDPNQLEFPPWSESPSSRPGDSLGPVPSGS